MKRLLALLLCVVFAINVFPLNAFADEEEEYPDDLLFLGSYEQELDATFVGPEGIAWICLGTNEDGTEGLFTTLYAIDVEKYSDDKSNDTWEKSSIREWLNSTFYNLAFTDEEKAVIRAHTVYNDGYENNPEWDRDGGQDTEDKVFLLSAADYTYYFGKEKTPYTDYALEKTTKIISETGTWWLRSPGKKAGEACVAKNGKLVSQSVDKPTGVCPAIWVDLTADRSSFPHERWEKGYNLYVEEDYENAFPILDELGTYTYGYFFAACSLACSAFECENDEERIQRLREFQVYCEEHSLKDPENPDRSLMFEEVYELLNTTYYSVANTAQANHQFDRAIELYTHLGNYRDSIARLLQCYDAAGINYAFFDVRPVNAGNKGGYAKTDAVTDKDLQAGWQLGRFIIAGFTEETSNGVFLKTLGDDITLFFYLEQDIEALNGNTKMSIAIDKEAKDVPFNYSEADASFGAGALLIQREDFRHNITRVPPYTNFLAANDTGVANTRVEITEEGSYQIALDYLIKTSGIGGKTEGYRISFSFDVKNGDGVVFMRDTGTTSELQDYSRTNNGFKIDMGASHSVKAHITRYDINLDGTALNICEDKPASDGDSFTKKGYYEIEMTNQVTGKTFVKHIFIGDQAELRRYLQVEPELGKFVK